MALDMARERLADSLLAAAEGLTEGRWLEIKETDLGYAFAGDVAPQDAFLARLDGAAWDYRHHTTEGVFHVERIKRDGKRRFVPPADRALFDKVGEAYFRKGPVRHADPAVEGSQR